MTQPANTTKTRNIMLSLLWLLLVVEYNVVALDLTGCGGTNGILNARNENNLTMRTSSTSCANIVILAPLNGFVTIECSAGLKKKIQK